MDASDKAMLQEQRLKSRKVYVVSEGMEGGYTPNAVSYFKTASDARDYMRDQADNARDDGYKVSGSARNGLYVLDMGRSLNEYIELDAMTLGELGIDSYDDLEQLNNA